MRRLLLPLLLAACGGGAPSQPPPNPGSTIPAVTYTLSLQVLGSGSISGLGSPCSDSCSAPIVAGTQVALGAAPGDGYHFDHWSGGCTGSSSCGFAMNSDVSVSATFVRDSPPDSQPPPASVCDSLLPAAPGAAPRSHFIPVADSTGNDGCGLLGVTGTGTVVLGMSNQDGEMTLDFVSASSGALIKSTASSGARAFAQGDELFALVTPSAMFETYLWDDRGNQKLLEAYLMDDAMADDPLGGVVVLGAPNQLIRIDTDGSRLWAANLPAGYFATFAVDRAGRTLYLFEGDAYFGANTVAGVWVDENGAESSVFEMLGPQPKPARFGTAQLWPQVGSGFFVQQDGSWIGQLDSLSQSMNAAPEWLVSQPGAVHLIHGGTGYGFIDGGKVNVVSADGTSCGAEQFSPGGQVEIGYDGTVVQSAADPDPAHQEWFGPGTCYWHWWPGYFR